MKIVSYFSCILTALIMFQNAFPMYNHVPDDQPLDHEVIVDVESKNIFVVVKADEQEPTWPSMSTINLQEEFDINKTHSHPNSHTPLISACTYLHSLEFIELLIKHKADVNHVMKETGWTPLHHACHYTKNPEIIKTLLRHGASSTALDNGGLTPLYRAMAPSAGVDGLANAQAFLATVAELKMLSTKTDKNNNNN